MLAAPVADIVTRIGEIPATRKLGRVHRLVGLVVEVSGLEQVAVGEVCRIEGYTGPVLAEDRKSVV